MFLKSLLVILPLAAYLFFAHVYVMPKDIEHYRHLTAHHLEVKKRRELSLAPAEQKKENVQKDIWLKDGRHVKLLSRSSHLSVSQHDTQIEIIEAMQEVHADLPDGLFVFADTGLYTSADQQLLLQGHVRLIAPKEPLVATADTLIYNLQDQSADLFPRVLFWKEGLALTAPKIALRADKSVHIPGDARIVCDLEEQNTIHQLIERYL